MSMLCFLVVDLFFYSRDLVVAGVVMCCQLNHPKVTSNNDQ